VLGDLPSRRERGWKKAVSADEWTRFAALVARSLLTAAIAEGIILMLLLRRRFPVARVGAAATLGNVASYAITVRAFAYLFSRFLW
jgi:hypothetical protein